MVVRRYVLILLRVEQDLSLTAFVAGASNSNLTKITTSENRTFCAFVNLCSFFNDKRYINASLVKTFKKRSK